MKTIISDLDMVSTENEAKVYEAYHMPWELKQLHTEDELIAGLQDADYVANQYAPMTRRVMENLPKLKFIVRYGVGLDNVDVQAATDLGIQVCNVPDYGMNEVSDHAITLALCLLRKVDMLNRRTKEVKWDYSPCVPIHRFSSMTCGVVGMGRIGRTLAKKMHALGFNVIGSDPFFKGNEETAQYCKMVSQEELIKTSDIISLHAPAMESTKGMINKETLSMMKPNCVLINAARGALIVDEDLDWALKNHIIAGAGLDTVSKEPAPADYFLFRNDNLLVTPHMAWYSEEAGAELQRKTAEEVCRFAFGEGIRYGANKPVNPRK